MANESEEQEEREANKGVVGIEDEDKKEKEKEATQEYKSCGYHDDNNDDENQPLATSVNL